METKERYMEIQQVMGSPCKITQQEARREVESQVFIFCLFTFGTDILFILYMYEKVFVKKNCNLCDLHHCPFHINHHHPCFLLFSFVFLPLSLIIFSPKACPQPLWRRKAWQSWRLAFSQNESQTLQIGSLKFSFGGFRSRLYFCKTKGQCYCLNSNQKES